MIDLRADFQERVAEVDAFIELVAAIERAVQAGVPLLKSPAGGDMAVKPLQQQLLCAAAYLHLYNLVEATMSRCIAAVEEASSTAAKWTVSDLSVELRKEWVRSMARPHESLSPENRLEAAIELCDHLVSMLPVVMKVNLGGGGNWDDEQIFSIAKRLGIPLKLKTSSDVKRPLRDGMGALQVIKHRRNKLAHGQMSFADCGAGLLASDIIRLKDLTVDYLSEVIGCFEGFISRREFLHAAKRPDVNAG